MLSFELDDWLAEEAVFKPLWRAALSNNTTVIQDDGRPGETRSAWLRLKDYLAANRLKITKFWLSFRSINLNNLVPDNAEGYFFIRNICGIWGNPDCMNFNILGYLHNGRVYTKKVKIPEMIVFEETSRLPDECGDCLIIN